MWQASERKTNKTKTFLPPECVSTWIFRVLSKITRGKQKNQTKTKQNKTETDKEKDSKQTKKPQNETNKQQINTRPLHQTGAELVLFPAPWLQWFWSDTQSLYCFLYLGEFQPQLHICMNFSLKGSFIMSILLGQSYLFCLFMSKTKQEATPSGFGHWDLLKNQKDKSLSYYLTHSVTPLPAVPSWCLNFPLQLGSPSLGRLDKTMSIHVLLLLTVNDQTRSLSIPLLLSSLCSGLQEFLLIPGSLAKIFFIPGPTFLSLLLLLGNP